LDDLVRDRIRGAILGSACGNSLGASCIGLNHRDIMLSLGPGGLRDFAPGLSKSFLPDHQPGAVLADTYLALTLADSVTSADGKFVPDDLKARYTKLLADPAFLTSAPGAPCLAALRRMADGQPPLNDGSPEATHDHGAARAYPLGCLPDRSSYTNIAVEQAKLTQADTRVAAAAVVVAASVGGFVRGQRLNTADEVRTYVKEKYALACGVDERFADSWDDVAPDLDYTRPAHELPYSLLNVESVVYEAVPTAVGIFLIFRHSLEEAICSAAVAGGDTDTVSAIVGALSGAYHGASAIPSRWLDKLADRERLEAVADNLANLW